jgi:hypothetical protein
LIDCAFRARFQLSGIADIAASNDAAREWVGFGTKRRSRRFPGHWAGPPPTCGLDKPIGATFGPAGARGAPI